MPRLNREPVSLESDAIQRLFESTDREVVPPFRHKTVSGRAESVGRRSLRSYWIADAPDGDALSLPPEPMELVACQIVPVVFVKKYRVPVDEDTGSAQAW